MVQTIPLFGPVPGGMEMMVILLIAVLLFGANKIPKLARSTGEAMGEFKKGRQEVEDELQEMRDGSVADSTTETTANTANTDTVSESSADTETEKSSN